jgi:hypothetical protein
MMQPSWQHTFPKGKHFGRAVQRVHHVPFLSYGSMATAGRREADRGGDRGGRRLLRRRRRHRSTADVYRIVGQSPFGAERAEECTEGKTMGDAVAGLARTLELR